MFSIINREYKGLVLLSGILLSCFFTILVSKSSIYENISKEELETIINQDDFFNKCNLLTIDSQGPISKIPLSIHIFSFLLIYFILCVSSNELVNDNIHIIVLFTAFLAIDIYYMKKNFCTNNISIIFSLVLGFIFGGLWYYVVDASNNPDLQFFNGKSNQESCSNTKKQFSCRLLPK
jgi:hypothetical protein